VFVHAIRTGAVVRTRFAGAIVDVGLAVGSSVPCLADTATFIVSNLVSLLTPLTNNTTSTEGPNIITRATENYPVIANNVNAIIIEVSSVV
jgi:hypothetical protein